ncbi:MAG: hypothetical protein ACPL3C_10585, partial [Pyrobaculum sp.]
MRPESRGFTTPASTPYASPGGACGGRLQLLAGAADSAVERARPAQVYAPNAQRRVRAPHVETLAHSLFHNHLFQLSFDFWTRRTCSSTTRSCGSFNYLLISGR